MVDVGGILGKYRIEILDAAGEPVDAHWTLEERLRLGRTLNRLTEQWRGEQEEVRESDLLPRRVGVVSILRGAFQMTPYGWVVECIPVSWAAHSMMQKRKIREALPKNECFQTFGVICVLVAGDGKIIISRRSEKVSVHPNCWDAAAAGWVNAYEDVALGAMVNINCEEEARRELKEETGLQAEDISSFAMTGLYRFLPFAEYAIAEACCLARTPLPSDEVLKRAAKAQDSWEGRHSAVTSDELVRLLEAEEFKPGGAAAHILALGPI